MSSPDNRLISRVLTHWLPMASLPMADHSQVEGRLRAILQSKRRQRMVARETAAVAVAAMLATVMSLAVLKPGVGAMRTVSQSHTVVGALHDTHGKVLHLDKVIAQFQQIYQLIQAYRSRHGGAYPTDFETGIMLHPAQYG